MCRDPCRWVAECNKKCDLLIGCRNMSELRTTTSREQNGFLPLLSSPLFLLPDSSTCWMLTHLEHLTRDLAQLQIQCGYYMVTMCGWGNGAPGLCVLSCESVKQKKQKREVGFPRIDNPIKRMYGVSRADHTGKQHILPTFRNCQQWEKALHHSTHVHTAHITLSISVLQDYHLWKQWTPQARQDERARLDLESWHCR